MHTISILFTTGGLLFLFASAGYGSDEKALPSRKPEIVVPLILKLDAESTFGNITAILGGPDSDIGSGIHVYLFKLDDGTYLRVGTPGGGHITYIDVLGKEQQLKKRIFPPGAKQPGS